MKKYSGILPVLLFTLAIALSGCGSDDNGGTGAEFDPTLYYTKTEVDALLQTVVTYADPDDYSEDSITGNDWAGRTSTGWTSPESAKGALMQVFVVNNDAENDDLTTYIEVSASDQEGAAMGLSMTVPADGSYYYQTFYVPVSSAKTIVAYHPYSAGHSGITDLSTISSYEITVRPLVWFK